VIVFFYAMFLMLGFSGGLLGTALPTLTTLLEVPPDQSGLFVSMQTGGAIIGLFIFGRLLDRYNTRVILWIPLTLVAFGLLGVYLAPSSEIASSSVIAFASFLLFGIGFGAVIVCGNISVARLFTSNATSPLNLLNLFYGVGGILGPQVVNWALAQNQVTLAFGAISIAAAVLIPFSFLPNIAPPARAVDQPRLAWTWSLWAALFPFIAFMFVYIGTEVGFSSWIYTRVINLTPLRDDAATTVVSLFWIGLTSGRFVGSVITRRIRDGVMLVTTTTLLTLTVLVILLFPADGAVSAVVSFAFGFAAGPVFSSVLALLGRLYPENAGQISGVILALANIGASLIPYLQGQVGRGIDGGFILLLLCGLILIGLAVQISARGGHARTLIASPTGSKAG
jgi:FHS family Na+ dependent glucose MFS transporter 1